MQNKRTLLLVLAITILSLATCANPGPMGTDSDHARSSRMSVMDSGGGGY